MITQDTNLEASIQLTEADVDAFKGRLRGKLLKPGEEGYDQARVVWNGMINKYPKLIVRCAGPSDVIQAVNFAREHNLLVAVKGGGHSIPGKSVCDNGLMIDLSQMRSVRVDPVWRIARAEAGALLSDLDHETQAFGLATTGGTVSHTGIAGLTLGGGQGWLMCKHGLTIDNLLSVDIVLADGRFLTASEIENEDLFWAIRGGGGNYGIVTSFEYRLYPVGPQVIGGMILYPMDQAREVLRFYNTYSMSTPDELSIAAGFLTLPDGMSAVALIVGWTGTPEEGEQQLKPLREFGAPMADMIGPLPYTQLQRLLDPAVPHGMHRYAKMGYIPQLNDEIIDVIIRHSNKMASPYSVVLLNCMKGAVTRIDPQKTPFPYRNKQFYFDIFPQWIDPSEADKNMEWARAFWQNIEPYTRGTAVNFFAADDGAERIRIAYGNNYDRLVALKNKYDPTNFFRLNNNIAPTSNM